jgi:hypothetical protein
MNRSNRAAFAALALIVAMPAGAALPDEIQVYTSDINKPREPGLELHVNTTPSGRSTPDFPGEIVPAHAWRITPEFSYGLTRSLEAGLYLPMVVDPDGGGRSGGWKLRLKWLPVQVDEAGNGTFAGVNFEYAWVSHRLEAATQAIELRPILGWRDARWLVAVNPILDFDRAGPDKSATPDFAPAFKIARTITEGIAGGVEYYGDLGRVNRLLPRAEQSHTLYLAIDVDEGPLPFNFGIGRGLNGATDRWTVKAFFEIPLNWLHQRAGG